MKLGRTHTIIKTLIAKNGRLTTATTGVVGGSEKEALYLFDGTVRAANTTHPHIVAVVLVDAADNAIAEWTKPVNAQVAA